MNNLEFKQLEFSNIDDFNRTLSEFSINTKSWDVKGVSSLYDEIQNKECIFGIENERLHRRVDVVCIKCFHTNSQGERFQLIEEKQVFNNGVERKRGFKCVSEKLESGELPEKGALRGLSEELQIFGEDVQVISLPHENKSEKKESGSYKGIDCTYNTFFFSCEIFHHYYQNIYVEVQKDKQTFFSWLKI
ncbi:MAG: hypothetical protein H0V82_07660 [Candidatus Protochlamydia sp.]|nr:hypothetical protein [Candidatus Protochlamydia sp.]